MEKINKLLDLRGRTAIITGAGGHLGAVIAEALAELGADLILVDRASDKLVALADKLKKDFSVNITTKCIDLESQSERDMLIRDIKKFGAINILVNNAAFVGDADLSGWAVDFSSQSLEAWRRAIEVNLTAVFEVSKEFAPLMKTTGNGTIINICSIYASHGPDWSLYAGTRMSNPAAYSVSKGGLLQLTRWLATTLCPEVRVNAISPGGIFRGQDKKFVERYEARTPLGRMAVEDDIRGAISFLATDLSMYITGQNIAVDGGWGVW